VRGRLASEASSNGFDSEQRTARARTVQRRLCWSAISIRGGNQSSAGLSLRQLRRDTLDSGSDARVVASIATGVDRSGHAAEHLASWLPLVPGLRIIATSLRAFALASGSAKWALQRHREMASVGQREGSCRRSPDGRSSLASENSLRRGVTRKTDDQRRSRDLLILRGPDRGPTKRRRLRAGGELRRRAARQLVSYPYASPSPPSHRLDVSDNQALAFPVGYERECGWVGCGAAPLPETSTHKICLPSGANGATS